MNSHLTKRLSSTQKGKEAEQLALHYLVQQRLRLVETNYSTRMGEIDLIMWQQNTLVFVEVRQRNNLNFGGAAASVGLVKQERLWKTAQIYLQRYTSPPACRFDLLAINGGKVEWIRDFISR